MQMDEVEELAQQEPEPEIPAWGELAFSAALGLVGVAVIIISEMTIRTGTVAGDSMGPRAFPRVVGAILVVCAGASAFGTARARLAGRPVVNIGGGEDELGIPASTVRAFSIMGLTIAYTAVLGPLGYLVATPIYFAIALWILEVRSKVTWVVICLVMPIGLYYLFAQLLGVLLPAGILHGFLVQIGWAV